LEAEADHAFGVRSGKGSERAEDGYPALEFRPAVEFLGQLGLTEQDDVEQLLLVGLEVEEGPDQFEVGALGSSELRRS
jgi:hypothetical protein